MADVCFVYDQNDPIILDDSWHQKRVRTSSIRVSRPQRHARACEPGGGTDAGLSKYGDVWGVFRRIAWWAWIFSWRCMDFTKRSWFVKSELALYVRCCMLYDSSMRCLAQIQFAHCVEWCYRCDLILHIHALIYSYWTSQANAPPWSSWRLLVHVRGWWGTPADQAHDAPLPPAVHAHVLEEVVAGVMLLSWL